MAIDANIGWVRYPSSFLLFRWEERKRWEGKVQSLRRKLDEANEVVSKLSRTNQGLREMANRVERDKVALENRARAMQKAMQVSQQGHARPILVTHRPI